MSFFSSIGKALKSRTVWAGVAQVALGSGEVLQHYAPTILSFVPPATPLASGIVIATGVATIIGRVMAHQPLGPVIDKTIAESVEAVHAQQGTVPTVRQIDSVTAVVKNQPGAINKAAGH